MSVNGPWFRNFLIYVSQGGGCQKYVLQHPPYVDHENRGPRLKLAQED